MRTCPDCGTSIEDRHPQAKRCWECHGKRKRSGKPKATVPCKCGCERLVPGHSNTGIKGRTFFEQACRDKYFTAQRAERCKPAIGDPSYVPKVCPCGKLLTYGVLCGDCRLAAKEAKRIRCMEANRTRRETIRKACEICGAEFAPEVWKERERCGGKIGKYCIDCRAVGDRILKYGAAYEYVNPIKIFERDGWMCQHCGKDTRFAYLDDFQGGAGKYQNPNGPTLDHILPIARGGAHSSANAQCLCWVCNSGKSARLDREPRLIGITDLTPFQIAKYPGIRQRPPNPEPRTCACGCGEIFTPFQNGGNTLFKAGHWNKTKERRDEQHRQEHLHGWGRMGALAGMTPEARQKHEEGQARHYGWRQDRPADVTPQQGANSPAQANVAQGQVNTGPGIYGGEDLPAKQAAMRARWARNTVRTLGEVVTVRTDGPTPVAT